MTDRPFLTAQGFTVIAPQTVHSRGEEFLNYRMERLLT